MDVVRDGHGQREVLLDEQHGVTVGAHAGHDRFHLLHQARRDLVMQSPKSDGEATGVFALRSPLRPNPIATVVAAVVRVEPDAIVVRGLDCIDGTPLIDIKPERCAYSPPAAPRPGKAGQDPPPVKRAPWGR